MLELDDIQSGVLRPRPTPYVATYIAFRIDDRKAGRELMRRVSGAVTSAANPTSPLADTWVSVALTSRVSKPSVCLKSRSTAFRGSFVRGWRREPKTFTTLVRAHPKTGRSPWGPGCPRGHRRGVAGRRAARSGPRRARKAYREMTGIEAIWRQNCHALPTETEPFGFRDGISHPAIEGSGIAGSNPQEQPFKAGEFVLGYSDEMGGVQKTVPEVLGRNGTYVVFRKLHQRVAAFRRYLKENSKGARR